ncbi:MAG: hypothetical protein ACOCYT_03915 [Chloroflexota bacterium]
MAIEFYDVKARKKIDIPDNRIIKTTFETRTGQVRYGLRAKTDDGRLLTKFISKAEWDRLSVPQTRSG